MISHLTGEYLLYTKFPQMVLTNTQPVTSCFSGPPRVWMAKLSRSPGRSSILCTPYCPLVICHIKGKRKYHIISNLDYLNNYLPISLLTEQDMASKIVQLLTHRGKTILTLAWIKKYSETHSMIPKATSGMHFLKEHPCLCSMPNYFWNGGEFQKQILVYWRVKWGWCRLLKNKSNATCMKRRL